MQRAFELELKSLKDSGEFEGFASTYGNVDDVGDLMEAGSFTRTLSTSRERPLLFEHRDAIGRVELSDTASGLIAKGRLSLGVQKARDAYELLKDGVIKAMSIGYETLKADYKGDVRILREVKLWEVSLVTLPANSRAVVTAVKSQQDLARLNNLIQEYRKEIKTWTFKS